MTPEAALAAIISRAVPGKDAEMAAYHKVPRRYVGTANPEIDALTKAWRADLTLADRLALARDLWAMDIHETRVAAAKLLTQARIRPDDTEAWELIQTWVPDFDAWAIADHAMMAGQRRLTANPARLDDVEPWVTSPHMWTRRAALVVTLPWTKQRHPKPAELKARERALGWAASYVSDPEWFIQKAVAWWLRDLSKRDPERVRSFLADHGAQMKPFARREAARLLPAS